MSFTSCCEILDLVMIRRTLLSWGFFADNLLSLSLFPDILQKYEILVSQKVRGGVDLAQRVLHMTQDLMTVTQSGS